MKKKLILISGSPCVGRTAAGIRLFESYDNSAYPEVVRCRRVSASAQAPREKRRMIPYGFFMGKRQIRSRSAEIKKGPVCL